MLIFYCKAMEREIMRTRIPVVGVVGFRNSGKTTIVEDIVKELAKKGYSVATAKHISQKGFSMDLKGKDTWRHAVAGANPVVGVSDVETSVLIKNGITRFSLADLLGLVPKADIIVLEGFSQIVLSNERIGKIFCVRNTDEYADFKEKTQGETIAFCSLQPLEDSVLRIEEDLRVLTKRVLTYVDKELRISKILDNLPGLDCKKCGYFSCEKMASAVYHGEAKMSDCVVLSVRSELKTEISVNDAEVPIQPFVSEIIRKSVLGMVSSLKDISVSGEERVHIKISS
jgi:molybdopterin-guanine dinucleotide biosynthesis protein B